MNNHKLPLGILAVLSAVGIYIVFHSRHAAELTKNNEQPAAMSIASSNDKQVATNTHPSPQVFPAPEPALREWVRSEIAPFVGVVPLLGEKDLAHYGLSSEQGTKVNAVIYDTYLLILDSAATTGEVSKQGDSKIVIRASLAAETVQALENRFKQEIESLVGESKSTEMIESASFDYVRNGLLSFGRLPITVKVEQSSPTSVRVAVATQWQRDDLNTASYSTVSVYSQEVFRSAMPRISSKLYMR